MYSSDSEPDHYGDRDSDYEHGDSEHGRLLPLWRLAVKYRRRHQARLVARHGPSAAAPAPPPPPSLAESSARLARLRADMASVRRQREACDLELEGVRRTDDERAAVARAKAQMHADFGGAHCEEQREKEQAPRTERRRELLAALSSHDAAIAKLVGLERQAQRHVAAALKRHTQPRRRLHVGTSIACARASRKARRSSLSSEDAAAASAVEEERGLQAHERDACASGQRRSLALLLALGRNRRVGARSPLQLADSSVLKRLVLDVCEFCQWPSKVPSEVPLCRVVVRQGVRAVHDDGRGHISRGSDLVLLGECGAAPRRLQVQQGSPVVSVRAITASLIAGFSRDAAFVWSAQTLSLVATVPCSGGAKAILELDRPGELLLAHVPDDLSVLRIVPLDPADTSAPRCFGIKPSVAAKLRADVAKGHRTVTLRWCDPHVVGLVVNAPPRTNIAYGDKDDDRGYVLLVSAETGDVLLFRRVQYSGRVELGNHCYFIQMPRQRPFGVHDNRWSWFVRLSPGWDAEEPRPRRLDNNRPGCPVGRLLGSIGGDIYVAEAWEKRRLVHVRSQRWFEYLSVPVPERADWQSLAFSGSTLFEIDEASRTVWSRDSRTGERQRYWLLDASPTTRA
eukprot:m51a1_g12847 hypothetical protein (626) ;mRNA; r:348-2393